MHATSRYQGLFPPHPFSKGKALRTRLPGELGGPKKVGDRREVGRVSFNSGCNIGNRYISNLLWVEVNTNLVPCLEKDMEFKMGLLLSDY